MKQVIDNLYWNLTQIAIHAKHDLADIADAHDLSVMQLVSLCMLEQGEPVPMNSISSWLSCDASNVTGIVDRLLASGLIVRQESPKDRRFKVISLTEKGAALRQVLLAKIQALQSPALQNLTSEQQLQLHTLVTAALTPKNA